MDPLNIVTIVTKSYLAFARTLAASFKKHNPDGKVFVLFADEIDGYFDPKKEDFISIQLDELRNEVNNLGGLCFQYKVIELCTALKPFVLKYLFQKYHLPKLAYFDPDILVMDNLQPLAELLENFDIILTPHLTKPYLDNKNPSEISIMQAGVYNLGFIALANTSTTITLLNWWQEKLYKYCLVDIAHGLFTDQKWIDLVPGFFKETYILRDPGYNVAYWNLHERTLSNDGGKILCNGEILRFFHFSGYDIDAPDVVSKHQDRHTFNKLDTTVTELFSVYRKLLIENGQIEAKKLPYAFDFFKNGAKIPPVFREIYYNLSNPEKFGNPFEITENSFLAWLLYMKKDEIPYYLWEMYALRPDVRAAYPDINNVDKVKFLKWVLNHGAAEFNLDINLLSSLKEYLEKVKPHDTQLKLGVNVFGYFNSEKGMGEVVRSDVRCLEKTSYPFGLCNIIDLLSSNQEFRQDIFTRDNSYQINLIHINADQLAAAGKDTTLISFANHYNIGYWAWELSQFPKKWLKAFENLDEIWVLSTFMEKTLAPISSIPVVTVPVSIEMKEIKNPSFDRKFFGIPENVFVFLFMFDFDSVYARKNPESIIKAFDKDFSENKNAVLVIKHMHAQRYPKELQTLIALSKASNVILIDETLSKEQVYALLYHADCYISLHRCEGFGLTMAEAMSMGKPVIATGYSGNTDFMKPNNSYLVNYQLVEIEKDYGPYKKGWQWAEPDLEHAASLMRYVYEHQEEAKAKGKIAQAYMREHFSADAVAKIYQQRLDAVRIPETKEYTQKAVTKMHSHSSKVKDLFYKIKKRCSA
jgi:glycosyltransferase involved in cell wall biosynthesis